MRETLCLPRRNMNRRAGKGEWSLSSPDKRVPATTYTMQKTSPRKAFTQFLSTVMTSGSRVVVVRLSWKGVITRAQQSRHGLPGNVGVIGFSLGGASSLTYATRMQELVSAVVVSYPATYYIKNADDFVAKIKVPTLMFAGGRDTYKDCCLIETARKLASAAKTSGGKVMLEVVEYPDAHHGWTVSLRRRIDKTIRPTGSAARSIIYANILVNSFQQSLIAFYEATPGGANGSRSARPGNPADAY